MANLLHGLGVLVAAALVTISSAWAQSPDPPARVGRLAYVNGTVSFHDRDETNWQPAVINYPMASGDALWTEPDGRAEVFVGATRLRMQGSTQLETLSLTDDQLQLRISQGRIDLKTAAPRQGEQVEVLTPRGSVMLTGDGDYMIEAGTTDDATRVGVRAGAARVIAANGSALIVRAGEIGVLSGTVPPVFETVRMATPPMPPEWAPRDRRIVATQSHQYVPVGMTGVEELDYYGTWSIVGGYGRVWSPRAVPAGWAPYRHGRWRWIDPWGWTWIDDQPWGFAPSHYGRWVNYGGRWYWIPPRRQVRPVYAPAVVGFVDVAAAGAVLAISASITPVGWFPLGPREVYVPPYTANRTYIRNINITNVVNVGDIDRRIEYVERRRDRRLRDSRPGGDRDRATFINQRFATVVPQRAFVRGERVDRAAIRVAPDRLARAQAAPVAAPTVATTSIATPPTKPGTAPDAKPRQSPAAPAQPLGAEIRRAPLADIAVLGRPSGDDRAARPAPGPQISRTPPATPGTTDAPTERRLPSLRTRDGRAVERAAPGKAAPVAPQAKPVEPPKPADHPVATPSGKPPEQPRPSWAPPAGKPGDHPQAAEPAKPPAIPPKAAQPPSQPLAPPQQAKPPERSRPAPQAAPMPPRQVTPRQAKPPERPRPAPQAAPTPPRQATPQQARPPERPRPAPKAAPTPPRQVPPQQARPPEQPRPAPQAAPTPRRQAPPQQARPPERPRPMPQAAPSPARPQSPPRQAHPPGPPPQPRAQPPQQARQPPGRDRDDKGGEGRRH